MDAYVFKIIQKIYRVMIYLPKFLDLVALKAAIILRNNAVNSQF